VDMIRQVEVKVEVEEGGETGSSRAGVKVY
jgi:hypothetical protein